MKTVEEKAFDDKIEQVELEELMYDEFYDLIVEAKTIGYNKAMRWRDPKEELPEYYKKVEIKIKRDDVVDYVNASLLAEDDGSLFFGDYNFVIFIKLKNVIGWRPIE